MPARTGFSILFALLLAGACLTPVKDLAEPDIVGQDASGDAEPSGADAGGDAELDADLRSDPRNCGALRHDCLLGDCTNGICEPFALASSMHAYRLVAEKGFVFWTVNSAVARVATDGTGYRLWSPETDPASSPGEIASDGTSIFWTHRNRATGASAVLSIPGFVDPPPAPVVLDDGIAGAVGPGIAVDGTHVYYSVVGTGEIRRRVKDALQPAETIAKNQAEIESVAVDEAHVYWTLRLNGVRRSSKVPAGDAGAIETIRSTPGADASTNLNRFNELVVDADAVYWREGNAPNDGSVWRWDKQKQVAAKLVPGQKEQTPHGITVDATHVYWSIFDPGTLLRAPRAAGWPVDTLYIAGEKGLDGIAVDDKAVYWTEFYAGRIMGIAK